VTGLNAMWPIDGVLVHGDEREVRRGAVAEPIDEVGLVRLPKRSFIHAADGGSVVGLLGSNLH
jgi:hypothetical protein